MFTVEGRHRGIEVESGLDGAVENADVRRHRDLAGRHLTQVRSGAVEPGMLWLDCRTSASDIRIGMAARTTLSGAAPDASRLHANGASAARRLVVPIGPGSPVTVDKTVALHTSRERAVDDPLGSAVDHVGAAPGTASTGIGGWTSACAAACCGSASRTPAGKPSKSSSLVRAPRSPRGEAHTLRLPRP